MVDARIPSPWTYSPAGLAEMDTLLNPQPAERMGLLLVLSGPSGCGKTTLARLLVKRDSSMFQSVSVTMRPPRPDEIDAADYLFVSDCRFDELLAAGELAEHAEVFGHRYGTARSLLESRLQRGEDTVLVLDWQGRRSLAEHYPGRMVSVFLLPPSIEELRHRLQGRAQDTDETITRRLAEAPVELQLAQEYDYTLCNEDIGQTLDRLEVILRRERRRRMIRILTQQA